MRRWNPVRVYWVLGGGITLANSMMFVVLSVYYVTVVGMNPLQLVLVGTVLEATILLFELPTGIVADTYSRRVSVVLAMFVLGAGWLLEGSIALFATILVAEAIRGVGETFLSGALDAWLADEIGADNVGAVYVRGGQIDRVVGLAAIGIGVALATIQPNYSVLFGGVVYVALGFFLALFMPEHGFVPAPRVDRNPLHTMRRTLRDGAIAVRGRPVLMALIVASALWGVSSEGFDRLWEALLLTDFTFPAIGHFQPVVWFGILSAAGSILSLAVVEAARPRLERLTLAPSRAARALAGLTTLAMFAILGLALAPTFGVAFVLLLAKNVLSALAGPLQQSWLVQNIPARVRATVLSMNSLSNALGQTVGGPGIGALGNRRGLRSAIFAAGLLILPEIGVFAYAGRDPTGDEPVVTAPAGDNAVVTPLVVPSPEGD
ncbi:MAG: MFS transporter [Anaerolineae bacterium]